MLISFEGIDGSGKSTQIEFLRKRLKEAGHTVRVFREPGGSEISERIRSILLDANQKINPVTELLLFSAARSQLVAEKVIPLLEEGTVVILDRFYDSTTAYQGYGRESVPIDYINEINTIASHQREPNLTFYMRLSVEQAEKRTAQKEKDRMERSGKDFYQKVVEGFDKLAESEKRFITLDAEKPKEIIQDQIWDHVSALL
ncbi:MAG: dTMP kinase [Balneolaceae bacterium]|nr:dTMP kinase [Balneolaceae bacterium]